MEEDPNPKRSSSFPLFSKELSLQPITVLGYATENRKQFEQFIEAFRRRILIQLQYATNLDTVSRSLDKFIQPGSQKTISFICSAFRVQHEQRARQARQLAESLTSEVFNVCQDLSKEQMNLIKKVQKQVKSMIKKFDNLYEIMQQYQREYEKASQQSQQLIISKAFVKYTSSIPQEKKVKLISKQFSQILRSSSSINQRKQIENKYLTAAKNYNNFVEEYNKLIPSTLDQLQTKIRDQISLQADCLRKLIVSEVSMFKNIEYDLINISKQMEALDTQKDLEIFNKEAQLNSENLITKKQLKQVPAQKQKRKSISAETASKINQVDNRSPKLLQRKEENINNGIMATCLKNIQEGIFTELLIHKKSKQFNILIEIQWNSLVQTLQKKESTLNNPQTQSKTEKITLHKIQSLQHYKQNLHQAFDQYFPGSIFLKDFIKARNEKEKDDLKREVLQNLIIITRYIFQIWNGKPITRIDSKKRNKSAEATLESPFLFIKKLLSAHHFYRLVSYSFIQSFGTRQVAMIQSAQRAQQIGKYVNCLITKSSKQSDIFVLRGILSLLFTFYFVDNNSKKHLSIQPSIYKNSLWKKQDFWDAAIFESTYEQMLSFGSKSDQSMQQVILKEKNLIFSQFASYCHYMIILGINSKSVRQIVGRFCRIYEMNEQQNRDLSKMITNTVKQYKQIFSLQIKQGQKDTWKNSQVK